jgi:putative protein-disulfide isomerase
MKSLALFLLIFLISALQNCSAQSVPKTKIMNQQTSGNPLLCNPETGICDMPFTTTAASNNTIEAGKKPVRLVYFTDPICSSCWGIEPQLRKLKLEYGQDIEIEYHMGGLLPDWSYNSGGISKPSDVAQHWDEVSHHYDMPIDGDIWLEDPLASSYPPSIACKAAELQDKEKAILFLRRIREMVFLEKKNITKWEHLQKAAEECGLDATRLSEDCKGKAEALFQNDLSLAKQWGVSGFPTIFVIDAAGNKQIVYGSKPYVVFEAAVLQAFPGGAKQKVNTDWQSLFHEYPTLTRKEFATLAGITVPQAEAILINLEQEGKLKVFTTKNGQLWKR